MQVLLAFIDARGAVLTRDDLIRICWGGAIVGEDAVNRTVAEIRRLTRTTGADFGVETIPRVGYRLTGALVEPESPAAAAAPATPGTQAEDSTSEAPHMSRRWLMGGAVAATAAAAAGAWALLRRRTDPRFDELMEKGWQAMRMGMPGGDRQSVEFFQEAVQIHPDDARAWGLLSLALRNVSYVSAEREAGEANAAAEQAARRALALEAREPYALFTLSQMVRTQEDWFTSEKRVRDILAIDPRHLPSLDHLTALLQAAGYVQESWDLNERAAALDPLRPLPQYRRALKLWILGRWDEADQQAAMSMSNWPRNNTVRNARLLVSAFTGRTRAARLLVEDPATAEEMLSPEGIRMWQTGLTALETHAPADVAAAREASLAAAPLNPGLSVHGVLLMSALGDVDTAYSVVEGFMLRRGLIVTRDRSQTGTEYEVDVTWRQTQWLFTPATKALRLDARFPLLADAIGLTEYWQKRGRMPDEQLIAAV